MGKEIAARQLTEMQRAFVRHMVRTGDCVVSATKAGYSVPEESGYHVAALLHIKEAIRLGIEQQLLLNCAPIAAKVLQEVAADTAAPAAARVAAAKTLLDRAGFAPKTDANPTLDAASMSTEQLKSLAGALHGELATRAKDVTGSAPNGPVIDAEVADILE